MREVILKRTKGELYVPDICEHYGFKKNTKDGAKRHAILRQHFVTSPANSETLWERGGRLYIFYGWLSEYEPDCFKWTSIKLVDVTDLVTEEKR